jgi:hypothetical protein
MGIGASAVWFRNGVWYRPAEGSAAMPIWEVPPVTIIRPVLADDRPDPRVDLDWASLALSRDARTMTVTARLRQPTSPTAPNWWLGRSRDRPGIVWGLNLDGSDRWQYVVHLRGDPNLGAYGFVERGQEQPSRVTCNANASFDGEEYRVTFAIGCLERIPRRIRFTASVRLFDDSGSGRLLGDHQPPVFSDWLTPPVVAHG